MKRLCFLVLIGLVVLVAGCSTDSGDDLVVYSGRSQPLVDGLVERFEQDHDVDVQVKYGKDAQLLAALENEGEQSPADVYWANTTGALTEAVSQDYLAKLPQEITDRPQRFVPSNQRWVPVTTRFRVLAYNSDRIDADQLPDSVLDLPEQSDLDGRIGWTPTYSSFQDFLTAVRVTEGEDAARNWVESMLETNPKSYTSNTPMIEALAAGEIDLALTNHYYVHRLKHGGGEGEYEPEENEESEESEEESTQPDAPVEIHHFQEGDPGNLAMVTGAGVLSSSDSEGTAQEFLRFLLSEQAQRYAAEQVNEYPVVAGSTVPDHLTAVEKALSLSPEVSPDQLQDIEPTLDLLRSAGAM